ncbi:unnamed protein product, partial [Meganyctiphanes norvegica]
DVHYEHWIGLVMLHQIFLKPHSSYVLQVKLQSWDLETRHAQYKDFSIGDEESGFKLVVGGYSGDAGDALAHHNGMEFSTKDKDYGDVSCAIAYKGGFWYNSCYHTNPFSPLFKKGEGSSHGIRWTKWLSGINLKKMVFKISPKLPH